MRYALYFALSIVGLTTATLVAFDRISAPGAVIASADSLAQPTADTLPTPGAVTPAVPTAADYARFAEADQAWRDSYARPYTVAELRARGDGRRTSRDSVQDRVFRFVQVGQRRQAIAELEHWVASHPTDGELLLSLARLLNEEGRGDDAIGRYRQLLALHPRGE